MTHRVPLSSDLESSDVFVLRHRPPKASLDPLRPYAVAHEEELDAARELAPTNVVFLTNRECPFRCVMCDLWRNTLDATVPHGAIAVQISAALEQLPAARHIKLYNAGSFFDPAAIPLAEDDRVARLVGGFERVIVESHPAFLRGSYAERCLRFRDGLRGRLEVAIGLETAHEPTLARLNKQMTLASFRRACEFLRTHDIDVRVFLLLHPPFLTGEMAIDWACRSLEEAAACGAAVCTLIPTRGGNGAMEALAPADVERPSLSTLERVLEYGVSLRRLRVFADLWDVERFFECECSKRRAARLAEINRTQSVPPAIACDRCLPAPKMIPRGRS